MPGLWCLVSFGLGATWAEARRHEKTHALRHFEVQERLRVAQETPKRPQARPKTAHVGPESNPRPPTQARQLHDQPSIENVEENIQRQQMLPVNFTTDHQSNI